MIMKAELVTLGFLLVLAGIVAIFIGMLWGGAQGKGDVRGGGVVLIGPFPIVFGSDTQSLKTILLLTIAIILLVYLLFYRR